jgi:hypothetical protein
MRKLKVILSVSDVPDNSIITKTGGTKRYQLIRRLEVVGFPIIECTDGSGILVPTSGEPHSGKHYTIAHDKEVIVEVNGINELMQLIPEFYEH